VIAVSSSEHCVKEPPRHLSTDYERLNANSEAGMHNALIDLTAWWIAGFKFAF